MDGRSKNHGGARRGAGRKKGIGMSYDIQKYCQDFIFEMLKNDAIRLKATKQVSMSFDTDSEDYLYIIKNDGNYKIGYSSNWKKRYKNYKTHLGIVDVIYLTKHIDAFDMENDLHQMFKDKRVKGEWFNLSKSDVIKAVSYCSSKIS